MGRINGTNSDYEFKGNGVVEVDPQPEQLYMKLYICPYNHLNALEEPEPDKGRVDQCNGTNEDCPEEGDNITGHALIQLHQKDGIELRAGDGHRILIRQNGEIIIGRGDGLKIVVDEDGHVDITAGSITINGVVDVQGSLKVNDEVVVTEPE